MGKGKEEQEEEEEEEEKEEEEEERHQLEPTKILMQYLKKGMKDAGKTTVFICPSEEPGLRRQCRREKETVRKES